MWTMRGSLVVLAALLSLGTGSVESSAVAAEPAAGAQDALHEVMPGDDLHLIAGYYYGDAREWERVWQANRDQIRNPNRIERGALLRIPDATVPAEAYADVVARAQRAAAPPGAPGKAEAPSAPQVEVRIAGEGPSAAPGSETAPPAPAAPGPREAPAGPTAQPAAPRAPRP
jgi:hypothetical protein